MPSARSIVILLGAWAWLAGCASDRAATDSSGGAGEAPKEYLDEHTGATVSAMDTALVFARDRSERAANLRDYVNLVAATVNRGGQRDYVLIAYVWSTLDARYDPVKPAADSLVLVADDRRIRLNANGKTPSDLGIVHGVGAPAGQVAKPLVFPTDIATLRFIAAARSLQIQASVGETPVTYELWEDQRPALDRFVRFLNGER